MDIEGDEFAAVIQMVQSGVLRHVKQIAMEFHFPMRLNSIDNKWRDGRTNIPLTTLRLLFEAGFRICMRDRNIKMIRQDIPFIKHPQTLLYDVTLVNLKYML